jgi:hypothetical protein
LSQTTHELNQDVGVDRSHKHLPVMSPLFVTLEIAGRPSRLLLTRACC